jgi:hypothetical protein
MSFAPSKTANMGPVIWGDKTKMRQGTQFSVRICVLLPITCFTRSETSLN